MIRNFYKNYRECLLCSAYPVQITRKNGFSSDIDFTKNNYSIRRGNYNTLEENHINFFRSLVGSRILMDLSDLEKYNVDYFEHLRGNSRIVLRPTNTQEVSKILGYCNAHRLAVCPQGANTSTVGGSVPVFDEIIISTELMNEIQSVDELTGVLICQAGCTLKTLEETLEPKELMLPLELGCKTSCQIGGNISANTTAARLLRRGDLHGNILGIEAVKADGAVLDCLNTPRKSGTARYLKNIFIGSEGTLGFITRVAIQCRNKPKSKNIVVLGLQKYEKVIRTFKKAREDLGEIITSAEVMDYTAMSMVIEHLGITGPIGDYPFYLLLETAGSCKRHDEEKLNLFLETTLNNHLTLKGMFTSDPQKLKALLNIKKKLPDSFSKEGHVFSYDISIALENYYTLVAEMKNHLGNKVLRMSGFGQLGDENLHLIILAKKFSQELKEQIEFNLFKKVQELNGSINANYGTGFLKANYLNMIHPDCTIKVMKELKAAMDPNGILNPYKVIPYDYE